MPTLKELGFEDIGDNAFQDAFQRFKDLADRKKDIFDEDIVALVGDNVRAGNERFKLVSLKVVCGTNGPQTAELELEVDGVRKSTTAKGDGPVRLVVADVTSDGAVRANAMFDESRLAGTATTVPALLGKGHLAFTVDQGSDTERYQGIVDLSGETLWECAQHYFRQSEQLQAGLRSAVRHGEGGWRGGGIMLQRLPDPEKQVPTDREDDWRRAMVLLGSATDDELVQPALSGEALLYRLYNEDGVRGLPGPADALLLPLLARAGGVDAEVDAEGGDREPGRDPARIACRLGLL